MKVYLETNTVYCFAGNCEVSNLDSIDFIMHKEGCTKHQAIVKAKALIGNAPVVVAAKTKAVPTNTAAIDFKNYLTAQEQHTEAKAYCNHRQLADKTIGYKSRNTPDKWGRGCIIFPLLNQADEVVSLYGRAIKGNGHYYQSDRKGLYPAYPSVATKTLVIGESIIDIATLQRVNLAFESIALLALFGTNGLTSEHRFAILQLEKLEEIIFCMDGDEAGRKAALQNAQLLKLMLQNIKPDVKYSSVTLPEGEDINSLAVAHEDAKGLFNQLFLDRTFLPVQKVETTLNIPAVASSVKDNLTKKVASSLQTDNPNNLLYTGKIANYAIKGGLRYGAKDLDSLKITLVIVNSEGRKSRQKLDLYEDKQVERVSRTAAEKLGLRADLVELDIQLLTDELEMYRDLLAANQKTHQEPIKRVIPSTIKSKCETFLKRKNLLQQINKLIGQAGITGEEVNRLLLFIVASSYGMPQTLHALIQGASGSGKTRLLDIISQLMPTESVKRFTRVTDSSFYNQSEFYFKNKLLCFEDIDGLKEEALLAVRELQSNEILITSSSRKDEQGNFSGSEIIVRGPIASLSCTTKAAVYEDNISRCFVVAVDESKEQDGRIIEYQNAKSAGIIDGKKEKDIRSFLRDCLRLLRPYEVINPFANKIQLPPDAHKIRRLNELYQSFVRQVTLLNQYQRKRDAQGRLITDKSDLQVACDILFESIVLKVDELDGSLRQFFEQLKKYVDDKGKDYEFNRFEVRQLTGMSKSQQHYYMSRLVELEYIRQWGFANRGYKYKIAHWDDMAVLRGRIKTNLQQQLQSI